MWAPDITSTKPANVPAVRKRRPFNVHSVGWLLFGIYAALVAMRCHQLGKTASWFWYAGGMALATLAVGLAVALMAWRLFGGSRTATTTGFVLLLVASAWFQHGALPAAVVAQSPTDAGTPAVVAATPAAQIATALEQQANGRQGDEAAAHMVAAQLFRQVDRASVRYNIDLTEFERVGGISPAGFNSVRAIEARIALVQRLQAANDELDGMYESMPQTLLALMRRRGINDNTSAGLLSTFLGRYDTTTLRRLRATDRRIFEASLNMLEMLRRNWMAWRYDPADQTLRFNLPTVADAYNRWFAAIDAAWADQNRYREGLLEASVTDPTWFALSVNRPKFFQLVKPAQAR